MRTSGIASNPNRITLGPVRERDVLAFHPETFWQRDLLLRHSMSLPEDVLVPTRRGALRVGGYVGLIDTGSIRLEILPRVSPSGNVTEDRMFLVNALQQAGLVPAPHEALARVSLTSEHWLEAVLRSSAVRLQQLLAEGSPRRYFPVDETSTTIRGRIDLTRLARRLPSEAHLFPIRHAPLQRDNLLSRMLRGLVEALIGETRDPETRRLFQECLSSLSLTRGTPLSASSVESVVLSEYESDWTPFQQLAAALIAGRAPTLQWVVKRWAVACCLSLDDVYERLLRRHIGRIASKVGLTLLGYHGQHLLESTASGKPLVRLLPDFLIGDADRHVALVADAKWKVLRGDGGGIKMAREDVYQMTSYMLRYESPSGLLLYPGSAGVTERHRFKILPRMGRLHIATVDVARARVY